MGQTTPSGACTPWSHELAIAGPVLTVAEALKSWTIRDEKGVEDEGPPAAGGEDAVAVGSGRIGGRCAARNGVWGETWSHIRRSAWGHVCGASVKAS